VHGAVLGGSRPLTKPIVQMKPRRIALAGLAAALMCAGAVHAAEFGLYPIHAVLTPSAESKSASLAAYLEQTKAADDFVSGFQARFPNVVQTIAESERWKSYAVALQLNRLSRYTVPKPDNTTDVYVAITATLYFTNVMTGQSLFTYTSTSYRVKPVLGGAGAVQEADVRQLVNLAYDDALRALIDKARASFKPYSRPFRITDRFQDAYIISGGALEGLQVDDELLDDQGNSLKVTYAGDAYAIAQVELGSISTAKAFTKISNAALSEVKKPGLLVIPDLASDDFDAQSVAQQFSDVIGDIGPFAVTTVTPQFSSILKFVSDHTGIGLQHLGERSVPEYFGVLTVARPANSEIPTNIPHKDFAISTQALSFKILDRGGRLVYADQGFNSLRDEVVGGVRFDPAARAEIVLRNALIDVASRTKTLAFSRIQLKVVKVDSSGFQIDDPKGALRPQSAVTLLTPFRGGGSDGQKGQVLVPTWSAHIDTTDGHVATGALDLPLSSGRPPVRVGDVIELSAVGGAAPTTKDFGVCAHAAALGGYDMADFDDAAIVALVRSGKVSVLQPERLKATVASIDSSGQFKKVAVPEFNAKLCIEPAQKIEVDPRHCANATVCSYPIHLTVGYRFKKGADIVFKSALQQDGASQSFPSATSEDAAKSLLSADVSQMAGKLLSTVVNQKSFVDGLAPF